MLTQNTIAIVFDFDDTLAPDSTSSFLEQHGVDVESFWSKQVNRLRDQGWDPIPAYLYMMLQTSSTTKAITQTDLQSWAKRIKYYPGVSKIFSLLHKHISESAAEVKLEFYMISSGIREIVSNTTIAKHFTDIWACDFAYDLKGQIEFPRNIISFTDKTRYLFHISKGLIGPQSRSQPFEVNRKIQTKDLRVPFDQMIFVGDGMTDVPCFSLVTRNGGWALGIYDPNNQDKWGRAWGFIEQNRVSNLVPADYRPSSALYHSLIMALNAVVAKMRARQFSYQG